MAHFAELNSSNEVIRVVVISNDDVADNEDGHGGKANEENKEQNCHENEIISKEGGESDVNEPE